MKLTRYGKLLKFKYIEMSLLVMICIFVFGRGFVTFEKEGNNLFHVTLNGVEIGTVDSEETAEKMLIKARRTVASENEELTFARVDMVVKGEEVYWGYVDDEEQVQAYMTRVVRDSVMETMHHGYVVKINDYLVNLGSLDDVGALLNAAIDKYDGNDEYVAEMVQDYNREFNVLVPNIVSMVEYEAPKEEVSYLEGGVHSLMFSEIEMETEEKELDLEDYHLGLVSIGFNEDVEIVEAYLDESQLGQVDQVIADVTVEQETPTIYTVKKGDTLSEISISVNIPIETIVSMNSELLADENSMLHIGDELLITEPKPVLSVLHTENIFYEGTYDADVIYIDNDSWYTTQTKVLQQPSAGYRKAVLEVSYVNDKEIQRTTVAENVLMEAVAKIVERGTKIPPTYIKPISGGRLSSGFGKRTAPTKGASTYHKGVDWATPTGTSVYASCGGKVSKAGWGNGYGYVVYIDHADGRQTRYAHLSKILVSVGTTVKQGDKIALSGNTGVSTGPHVHFEILINGSQVNPLKYIS